jgi:hypothetical protein
MVEYRIGGVRVDARAIVVAGITAAACGVLMDVLLPSCCFALHPLGKTGLSTTI